MAWAVKLRVNPQVIRVQEMRRKWGSGPAAGTITFAAELVKQEAFQASVIVHALLHLRFPNHGREFKASLAAYVRTWREMASRIPGHSTPAGPGVPRIQK